MGNNTDTNDPANYKWGIFYFNPDDLRAVVPKRNRWMGYTLNFAQPFAWVILLGIVALAILIGKLGK